jgi:hypothetical protein
MILLNLSSFIECYISITSVRFVAVQFIKILLRIWKVNRFITPHVIEYLSQEIFSSRHFQEDVKKCLK